MRSGTAVFWLAGASLVFVACDDVASTSDLGSASDAGPLSQCIRGWFLDSSPDPCFCASSPPPECAFSDCGQHSFEGFLANDLYYGGVMLYSPMGRSMSTFASSHRGSYSVMGASVTMDGRFGAATCTGQQLTIAGFLKYRASPQLSAAFDAATADGGVAWRGYPVSP